MGLDLTVVDSFTDRPFTGNPAAVAVVGAFPPEHVMQAIAREMNLSETAFVVPRTDSDHDLRWFTPSVEVDLCGHATLASAHVLGGFARFWTRSGLLACSRGEDGWIKMDFPSDVPSPSEVPSSLDAGGIRWYGCGRSDILIELEDVASVRSFVPDLQALAALGSRTVIITARGNVPGIDCVSRVFGPNAGIAEDPVTGSAHCTLAAYWSELIGKEELVGEQASARGGIVRMRVQGDRVVIGGQAVTTARVHLAV
jgi:predicted PhzF superfamily epimerase YddE/YHI9